MLEEIAARLRARDPAGLTAVMGSSLVIGYWASEGDRLAPGAAAERLLGELGPQPTVAFDPAMDPALVVGADWAGMFGPGVTIAAGGALTGWGIDGTGAAVAYLVEADGQLVWYGIVINPLGHAGE